VITGGDAACADEPLTTAGVNRSLLQQARESGTVQWLLISVGLSVILTVLLNVGLRAFPEAAHRLARSLTTFTWLSADDARRNDRRVRVFIPWKAMVLGSLIVTIVVNVVLWIA
jgi:hypothetical protein